MLTNSLRRATSGLSQSNYYYEGNVFPMCPLLLIRFHYPNNSAPI
jgi:hypothetical protein